MAKVVHCKKSPYDVYIGRPSIWGNPFEIGKDGTRSQVIKKYESYLRSNKDLINKIESLDGLVLGCWCKPNACHGDVIVKIINELKQDITK